MRNGKFLFQSPTGAQDGATIVVVPKAPTRNGLEMQHLQAIFASCPFLSSFPLAFISDTLTEDQVFCLLMFRKLCFLLGARSKGQEGSINACLSRVSLFRVKKYHGKRKKMLYHVTYCKKKAYICPSETIKNTRTCKRRDKGRTRI